VVSEDLQALVIGKTFRVPAPAGPSGNGEAAARQFDVALMSAGFKCSGALLEHLSDLDSAAVIDTAVRVLATVRRLAGDHVQHSAYFKDFPSGVPDTVEFWMGCLREAMLDPVAAEHVEGIVVQTATGPRIGMLNLLSLPSYGRYQHKYQDLLAAHDELVPAAGDRVTVLHLGAAAEEELRSLYLDLAGSRVPLSDADRSGLGLLAAHCAAGPQPETIPIRENRAVINGVRLAGGQPLLAGTVTDVLRLASAVSDGDVSLEVPARLRSFSRKERRVLLAALDAVVAGNRAKLGDVAQYAERWKRLGERLHPHEHPQWPGAQDVFAVARGEIRVPSLSGRVEAAMGSGDVAGAAALLAHAPGRLMRSVDWLLRSGTSAADSDAVLTTARAAAGQVSGRVLLSLREHVQNRGIRMGVSRVFVNRKGRGYALPDTREALDQGLLGEVLAMLDAEAARRVPVVDHLVVDPAVAGVALPLSGKTTAAGLGMLPRGSVSAVDGEWLRFFVYWHQQDRRTDYDLSALMLDEAYANAEQVSWTNLRTEYAEYSGDLTQAENGASEFINIRLAAVPCRFIIPQVYIYAGEGFDKAKEAFFGFMTRAAEQKGLPFEPRTVRMKSDLRGAGRIALPLVFMRGDDGKWRGKWLHLYLKGRPSFNQVEGGTVTTGLLTRAIVERDYLRVSYITDLMAAKAGRVTAYEPGCVLGEDPVTFVGLEQPEGLPPGSEVFTLNRLRELVPA
jgi:hypothetical protein